MKLPKFPYSAMFVGVMACGKTEFLLPGGYFHIRRAGGLAPNFVSEILVGAPNFASNNINDKYPKFCPLNFRYDPKTGTFSQLLLLLVTELPKFLNGVGNVM